MQPAKTTSPLRASPSPLSLKGLGGGRGVTEPKSAKCAGMASRARGRDRPTGGTPVQAWDGG